MLQVVFGWGQYFADQAANGQVAIVFGWDGFVIFSASGVLRPQGQSRIEGRPRRDEGDPGADRERLTHHFHTRTKTGRSRALNAAAAPAAFVELSEGDASTLGIAEGDFVEVRSRRGHVEHEAPDAIAIVPDQSGQIAASLPKRPTSLASMPDPIWGSLAAAALLLVVGLLGVLVGLPWLVPSLGPSAVLLAVTPAHPTARPWNTIVGHAGGMVSGFAAVAVLGAATAPTVLGDHQLVPVRVAAAVLAIGLTVGAGFLLRASHPPAAATTLLVALGSIATLEQGLVALAGVVILTGVGEFLRELRRERVTPGERMAPRRSILEQRLRGG